MSGLLARLGRTGFLIIVGLVVIVYVALGIIYFQQGAKRADYVQQILKLGTVISKPLANIETLRADYAKVNAALAVVPAQEILNKISLAAEASGLDMEASKFTFPAASAPKTVKVGTRNYQVISYTGIKAQGEYNRIMDFISRIDSGQVLPTLILKTVTLGDIEIPEVEVTENTEGQKEYESVAAALMALLKGNNLYSIPNPTSTYAGGKATNDMGAFPDSISGWAAMPVDKLIDPAGNPYASGIKLREEGFILREQSDPLWVEGETLIATGQQMVIAGKIEVAWGDNLWEQGKALWDKGNVMGTTGESLMAEGTTVMMDGNDHRAAGQKKIADGTKQLEAGQKLMVKPGNPWTEGDNMVAEGTFQISAGEKVIAEGDRLWEQGNALWIRGNALREEGDRLVAEAEILLEKDKIVVVGGAELTAQGYNLRSQGYSKQSEGNQLMTQAHTLMAEGEKRRGEGNLQIEAGRTLITEGEKLWNEGNTLWVESDKTWEEGDKIGFVLFHHDNKADRSQNTLVDYISNSTTTYYYTYDMNGKLRQFDGPDVNTAKEYTYSNGNVSNIPATVPVVSEVQVSLDIDLYSLPPAAPVKTTATNTPAATSKTP